MVLPQKTGFGVVYNQILPNVGGNKKEAFLKAGEFWKTLSQEERNRRNEVAAEIWKRHLESEAAKKEVKIVEEKHALSGYVEVCFVSENYDNLFFSKKLNFVVYCIFF
jgi:hypothetical protein